MDIEFGWNIVPIVITFIVFALAVLVHLGASAGSGKNHPAARDLASFLSLDAILIAVIYFIATVVSLIAWGIYFIFT